jgi:hypothetical protein
MDKPELFDIKRIQQRLDILNETCNRASQEAQQTGRLRVPVEPAFRRPEGLIQLIGMICLLKKYAEAAAVNYGENLGLEVWVGFFNEFDRSCHIMPSGKPQ